MPLLFRGSSVAWFRPLRWGWHTVALTLLMAGTAVAAGAQSEQSAQSVSRTTVRGPVPPLPSQEQASPRTRAERTNYTETSHYADVIAFLDSLVARPVPLVITELGRSGEGRVLPLVIASRPVVRTPAEARALNRPIVLVQANIHAGEVEGKEAVLALLRDLSQASAPNVLDSVVLLVVPIYNADGNERFLPQARQRGSQNGPELVGQRPNAQGLDLNRDYVKVEAPETRAGLAALNAWDPHVFMDLHTTNGSFHGYHLTYAPSLHPAAPLGIYTGDTLLVTVRERMAARHEFRVFPYGNFTRSPGGPRESLGDTLKAAFATYDHRQRFGTNYVGLRGRIAILSEAFSHDPFAVRVASTRAFVQEVLSYVAEHADGIRARTADAARASTFGSPAAEAVPLRARLTTRPDTQVVLVEVLERLSDTSAQANPGMPGGWRRTGRMAQVPMPVVDRFESVLARRPPVGGWVIESGAADSVLPRLRAHGVTVEPVNTAFSAVLEQFVVDSITRGRPFQGHEEVTITGQWVRAERSVPAGSWLVRVGTPADRVAMLLLEPESDDGLTTWNLFDTALAVGRPAPVWRLTVPAPTR